MLHLTFPTHLAIGYLLGVSTRFPIAPLVLGSAFPDLVDRPLYWLGLTPFTHTVAHSIAVALPVCAVLSWRFGRRGAAFSIGWLVHVATDFLNVVTTQGPTATPYYVLYVTATPDEREAFATVTIELPLTAITHTAHPLVLLGEVVIVCWAIAVFVRDGGVASRLQRSRSE